MFTILNVQLTNFRSWVGTHEWVINQGPGLYYLTGQNHDNPRLSRNGVGKSSLLDAICFCFYGKSTRAIRGPGVVSRGHSTCAVSCKVVVDSEQFTVTRIQNPNSLKINGEIVEQDALTKKLRLNFESFLYAVISPQSGHSFLDLSAGEKLNLFSSIMELNYWLEASEKAAKKAKGIEDDKYITNQAISRYTGIATSLASTISDLKVKAEAFDHQKTIQLNELDQKRIGINSKLVNLKMKMDDIIATVPMAAEFEEAVGKMVDRSSEIKELERELIEAYKVEGKIEAEINRIRDEKVSLMRLGAICPSCKQKIDEIHIKDQTNKLNDSDNKCIKNKALYKEYIESLESNKSEIYAAVADSEARFKELKAKERMALDKLAPLIREADQHEWQYKQYLKEIDAVTKKTNEYEGLIIKKKAELEAANDEVSVRKSDIARMNEEYAAVNYWVAGFKRVRLFIIEDALNTLEVEVNNNLTALGMGNWKINFDVERENKSGGVTKGFTTMITDPKGNTVPYDTLSFGETQRVKLAGCFGLANLIMERVGLSSKFEVYDEITQHMSAEGIEDTLNILRDRAILNDKVIVLIDHQAIEYGDFAGTINLVRDETGSRFS